MFQIIFVLPDLTVAGAATRTTLLAECLAARGHSVLLAVATGHASALVQRLSLSGVISTRLLTPLGIRLVRHFAAHAPRLVVHAAVPTGGALGICLARALSCPLVYTYANCPHVARPVLQGSTVNWLKARLERFIAQHGDVLHAVSRP